MVNPIGGRKVNPYLDSFNRENTQKRLKKMETSTKGVIVDINPLEEGEETFLKRKIEDIKKLVKEGKYPLDRSKLAEKILEFFTDGG